MSTIVHPDDITKAKVVNMILNKKTEEALKNLSKFYKVIPPEITVGTIKGKRKRQILTKIKTKSLFQEIY